MNQQIIDKAVEIISANRFCSLALIDLDGYPTASAITVSKNDGINWLTFGTGFDSAKVKRINQCDRASICFFSLDPAYNITLTGKIEVITDPDVKKEMWFDGLECDFTGADDPNYCILKFKTERYNLMIGEETGANRLM